MWSRAPALSRLTWRRSHARSRRTGRPIYRTIAMPRSRLSSRCTYRPLLALARRLLDDPADAEDVVMDSFVGLYRRWGSVRHTDNPLCYLRASVVNGSRNRLRRLRLATARLFSQFEPPAPAAEQSAMLHVEHDAVVKVLQGLARRQREVLVLRYYEQLSEAEIATTLGCSVGSVKTHASRGIQAVAERLGGM